MSISVSLLLLLLFSWVLLPTLLLSRFLPPGLFIVGTEIRFNVLQFIGELLIDKVGLVLLDQLVRVPLLPLSREYIHKLSEFDREYKTSD